MTNKELKIAMEKGRIPKDEIDKKAFFTFSTFFIVGLLVTPFLVVFLWKEDFNWFLGIPVLIMFGLGVTVLYFRLTERTLSIITTNLNKRENYLLVQSLIRKAQWNIESNTEAYSIFIRKKREEYFHPKNYLITFIYSNNEILVNTRNLGDNFNGRIPAPIMGEKRFTNKIKNLIVKELTKNKK